MQCLSVIGYLIILLQIFTDVASGQKRATFGEECNRSVRCDSKSSLKCDANICQCVMPENMVFDSRKGKCVTIAGEKCVYTAVEVDDSSESETKRWREELDCVSDATCVEGFCVCSKGYFENNNGTCEVKHSYGEICENNNHCKEAEHFLCKNRTCVCDQSSNYDHSRSKCVGVSGALCKIFADCVINAECPPKRTEQMHVLKSYWASDEDEYDYSRKEVDYTWEVCNCKKGYTNTSEGYCLASYGNPCGYTASQKCLPGFVCREWKCSCKYDNHEHYDRATQTCKSLIGGPCTTNSNTTSLNCVQNAECVPAQYDDDTRELQSNEISNYVCACKQGFIENARQCELAFGEKCQVPQQNPKCDSIAPLQCIEGVCQCNFLEYFDHETKKCRGLVGSACIKGNVHFCTDGAICKSYRNVTVENGRCICSSEYRATSERKCELKNEQIIVMNSRWIVWSPMPTTPQPIHNQL
ncbi:unnamed protein product [Orchesella dallaii]|uniref:EGF-like domain-containing protein n=1 Tax=Orchesella dallaii TaxID=48710 RepID=A0ABP1R7G5_9HEXA